MYTRLNENWIMKLFLHKAYTNKKCKQDETYEHKHTNKSAYK